MVTSYRDHFPFSSSHSSHLKYVNIFHYDNFLHSEVVSFYAKISFYLFPVSHEVSFVTAKHCTSDNLKKGTKGTQSRPLQIHEDAKLQKQTDVFLAYFSSSNGALNAVQGQAVASHSCFCNNCLQLCLGQWFRPFVTSHSMSPSLPSDTSAQC